MIGSKMRPPRPPRDGGWARQAARRFEQGQHGEQAAAAADEEVVRWGPAVIGEREDTTRPDHHHMLLSPLREQRQREEPQDRHQGREVKAAAGQAAADIYTTSRNSETIHHCCECHGHRLQARQLHDAPSRLDTAGRHHKRRSSPDWWRLPAKSGIRTAPNRIALTTVPLVWCCLLLATLVAIQLADSYQVTNNLIANNLPPKFVQSLSAAAGAAGATSGAGVGTGAAGTTTNSEIVVRVKEGPQSIGRLIYTLKGEDPDDDPLTFGVLGTMASDLLRVENVPGNQANVYLRKELDRETTESHQVVITLTDGKLGRGNWVSTCVARLDRRAARPPIALAHY
jgi:hypothetical protein